MEIITELEPVGELYNSGRYAEALTRLEEIWGTIPAPKETTLNSFLVVSYGAVIALKGGDLDKAWEWAERGMIFSGNVNLGGESEFLAGEVAYARSDFMAAKRNFALVKKNSGWRLFRDKDPKYKRLIS